MKLLFEEVFLRPGPFVLGTYGVYLYEPELKWEKRVKTTEVRNRDRDGSKLE